MTTTGADLPVPDEALEAHIYQHRHVDDPTEAGVRRIAAPVVAAELRRLANSWVGTHVAATTAIHQLRVRADALDADPR